MVFYSTNAYLLSLHLLAIVFETIAISFLNQSEQFSKLWLSVMMIVSYGTIFFSIVLKTMPIGIAYAIWSGADMGYSSKLLDFPAILGMNMIIAGVIIINLYFSTLNIVNIK